MATMNPVGQQHSQAGPAQFYPEIQQPSTAGTYHEASVQAVLALTTFMTGVAIGAF